MLAGCATSAYPRSDGSAFGSTAVPETVSETGSRPATERDPESAAQPIAPPRERDRRIAQKGDWEVSASGSGSNDDSFDNGSGGLVGTVGYYPTDALEIGVRQSISYVDLGGAHSWDGHSRIFTDLHLTETMARPYVGVNVGYVYGQSTHETFEAAPEAGIKIYLREKAFLEFHVEYQFFLDEDKTVGATFDNGQFVYALGFGLNF